MNKLEKDILDSEMGLYSRYKNESEDTEKEETSLEEPAESEAETIIPEEYTEDGIQLSFADMLGDMTLPAEPDQDELDMSSLKNSDEKENKTEKQHDGSRLYHETVILLESGEVDLDHCIALLKKNAADGHALSYLYLGQLYSNKTGIIYNPALAFDCYDKAAKLSDGRGYYNAGLCCSKGFGCEKNAERAVEYFSEGAKIFNAECIFALGSCYEYGVGCELNYEYAVTLYQKGYELGHAGATNNLGG